MVRNLLCAFKRYKIHSLPPSFISLIPFLQNPVPSMDVHPSRELVASGQRAGRDRKSQAHVRIWSTETLQTLYVFGMGELDTGVSAVAFSQLVSKYLHKQYKLYKQLGQRILS